MKDLVTVHQARKLKKLGFKKPTVHYTFDPLSDNSDLLGKSGSIYSGELYNWNGYGKGCLFTSIPTIDQAIDWFREKHHIVIFHRMVPYVDPSVNKIVYAFGVNHCNLSWGWNQRIHICSSNSLTNIYAAKRKALTIAINYWERYGKKKSTTSTTQKSG